MNNIFERISFNWENLRFIIYAVFIFLKIDIDVLNVVMYLICIDVFTGAVKSIVIPTMSFSFMEMYKGLLSKVILILIPMVIALAATAFNGDLTWFVNGVIKVVILSEVVSILTNFLSIRKREELRNKDYMVILIERIISQIKKIMDKIFLSFDRHEYNNKNKDDKK